AYRRPAAQAPVSRLHFPGVRRQGRSTHRSPQEPRLAAQSIRVILLAVSRSRRFPSAKRHAIGDPTMIRLPFFGCLLLALCAIPASADWKGSGKNGAVAAGGQEAVDAGIAILKSGGNAVDAAAATILALSVTDSNSFCFGGEVPILV